MGRRLAHARALRKGRCRALLRAQTQGQCKGVLEKGRSRPKAAAPKGFAAKSALRPKASDTPVEVDSVTFTLRSRHTVRFQEEDAVYELACRLERPGEGGASLPSR